MAEKQTLPHAYSITLTYADIDGQAPLGARVFRYKDVEKMWKRIRAAGTRKWGKQIELRYVIVGEKGTLNGRCHYHGVLFSDHPIHELGKLSSRYGEGITYSTGRRKVRHDWSIWGHGFVDFQRPDRKGMAYALKYILKGRMTSARSEGFKRQGKTEWLASSTLWSSKGRSIGEAWLFKTVVEGLKLDTVPHSLRIRVPDGGDWYVAGPLREKLCAFLHGVASERHSAGKPPFVGWQTLMAEAEKGIKTATGKIVRSKTWEILNYGQTRQKPWRFDWENQKQRDRASREKFTAAMEARRPQGPDEVRDQYSGCFGVRSCKACERARGYQKIYDDKTVENLWREAYDRARERYYFNWTTFEDWITRQGIVADGCVKLRQNEVRTRFYAERRHQEYNASLQEKARPCESV